MDGLKKQGRKPPGSLCWFLINQRCLKRMFISLLEEIDLNFKMGGKWVWTQIVHFDDVMVIWKWGSLE